MTLLICIYFTFVCPLAPVQGYMTYTHPSAPLFPPGGRVMMTREK